MLIFDEGKLNSILKYLNLRAISVERIRAEYLTQVGLGAATALVVAIIVIIFMYKETIYCYLLIISLNNFTLLFIVC